MARQGAEHLTEADFAEGAEAYVHYCGGLACLQFPYEMEGLHGILEDDDLAELVINARNIMFSGARRIIRAALPPEHRGRLRGIDRSGTYHLAEKAMRDILGFACFTQADRLEQLNDMYAILRPAPFLDPLTYNRITRGDYARIPTADMMDDFVPHPDLINEVYSSLA